jgi:hypothetical protein
VSARVVLGVRKDDRASVRRRRATQFRDGLLDGEQLEGEFPLAAAQFGGKQICRAPDQACLRAAGVHGGPAVRHVGGGKSGRQAHREQRQTFDSRDLVHQRLQGLDERGLGRERDQVVHLLELAHHRWTPQQVVEHARGPRATVGHVHVRVGAVGDQCRRLPCHLLRHVRVEVEAGDHGYPGADHRADPPQQFTVGIVDVPGHHGAVQVEIDGVDGALRAQVLEQQRRDALVGIAGDAPGRLRRTPAERQQFMVQRTRFLHEAGGGQVDAGHGLEHGRAARESRPRVRRLEIRVCRGNRRKRVRLVLEAADRDARHGITPLPGDRRAGAARRAVPAAVVAGVRPGRCSPGRATRGTRRGAPATRGR